MIGTAIIKIVVGTIAGTSASFVVESALSAVLPVTIGVIKKTMVGIGTFVIAGIAYKAASNYVQEMVDDILPDRTKKKEETKVV